MYKNMPMNFRLEAYYFYHHLMMVFFSFFKLLVLAFKVMMNVSFMLWNFLWQVPKLERRYGPRAHEKEEVENFKAPVFPRF